MIHNTLFYRLFHANILCALGCIMLFAVKFKQWGLPYLPTGADILGFERPDRINSTHGHAGLLFGYHSDRWLFPFSFLSILEVLSLDYIRTARAKGLTERMTLYKHAFRNDITTVRHYHRVGYSDFDGSGRL
ncbi:MAG: hypothetical protein IPJ47_22945 [Anaerolineales bacterium]|nr:hypothetical protein [Anaerolineales bacterium]